MKRRRAAVSIGSRWVRCATSAWPGAGTRLSEKAHRRKGTRKTAPHAAGIHASLTPESSSDLPTVFTTPDATMYAQLRPAPRISEVCRPSRKLKQMPQTVPSGRPLRNMAPT